jgi:hypothetical protein
VSRPGRALPPGKGPPVPIGQEAGWAPEPVWTQRLEEKSFASAGDRIPVVQSAVRHCTELAPLKTIETWSSYQAFESIGSKSLDTAASIASVYALMRLSITVF